MKKIGVIQLICCALLLVTSCTIDRGNVAFGFGKGITGNGVLKEQSRGNMDFSAIDVRGSVDVFVSDETNAPVMVSGDENLIEYIETTVDKGVLNIRFKKGLNYSSKKGLKVTVPNNGHISSVTASGSSDVLVAGILTANNLEVFCKGSSDFKGDIKAQTCKLDFQGSSDFKGKVEAATCKISCSGSSDCILKGKADVCETRLSGSCDFRGYNFFVDNFDCSLSGSSSVQITCNKEISAKASGSSDIYYKGSANVAHQKLSGSSEIHRR